MIQISINDAQAFLTCVALLWSAAGFVWWRRRDPRA